MSSPRMIGLRLGRYQIVEKIGEGGMRVVYRARDEHLDRDVALKVLSAGMLADEAARKRFRKDDRSLLRNIVSSLRRRRCGSPGGNGFTHIGGPILVNVPNVC